MRHALRVVAVPSLLATAVVLAQAPAGPKPTGMDEMQVVFLKDARWTAAKPPIPAGVMVSLIAADPAPGGSLAYVKFPAGVALALPRPSTRRSASPAASAFSSPVEADRPTTTG